MALQSKAPIGVLLHFGLYALASASRNFDELFRPQFHFSPDSNWINDPNGLLYHKGEYHLFYQYNPHGIGPANMSWGHAVSRDLVHWNQLPVAILYDSEEAIFSGSAVSDGKNSSGLGRDGKSPLVAYYTSARSDRQAQSFAYSVDDGKTWTKYAGNPVIDHGLKDFRDPRVFWHEPTNRWILLLVVSTSYFLQIYSSTDLKNWKLESLFGPKNAQGGIWECPDLFPLHVDGDMTRQKWVLIISINPGGPQGGSATQYFVGDFNGTHFVPDDEKTYIPEWKDSGVDRAAWIDYGKDYYASISWTDVPEGRRIMIGWMSNWLYADQTPTKTWRNAMSVPRELTLKTIRGQVRLVQTPVQELAVLRASPENLAAPVTVSDMAMRLEQKGTEFDLTVKLTVLDAVRFGLAVRGGMAQETVIGYNMNKRMLCVDRTLSGKTDFSETFPGVHCAPLELEGSVLKLRVLVDRSSVEVFAGEGEVVITDLIYPQLESNSISVFAEGGTVKVDELSMSQMKAYRA